ncbi:MAG: translocation/assembly module TamB domain-containing protein [Cypionkella sp.]|nr:translocation/assembly module TamB domain-containing protein [Cypionkella sp.]
MARASLAPAIAVLWALWPMGLGAQTDDRDYLTALLEDNLSGAGRQVVITGFEGALSSQARMQSLTIADDEGVWISLTDVVLDWQRSDLLSGKITVNNLTAAEISLSRIPKAGEDVAPEAPAFALPDLPVAINIGTIAVEKLHLAAPVLGQEVNASAAASMQLAGGEGQGKLTLVRDATDVAQGQAVVDISFANATRWLKIDLQAAETTGGILAQALGIPDAPALEFTAAGDAPLSDFTAQLALSSDNIPRFGGKIAWASTAQGTGDGAGARSTRFDVDLAGDLSLLFKPEYRPFFGVQTALRAQGQTRADGGFDMPAFALTSAAMDIQGRLALAASGQPDAFSLGGQLRSPDGSALILPLGLDKPAAISSAQISADFDGAKGDAFHVAGQLQNWAQDDLRISNSQFNVDGRLARTAAGAQVSAKMSFSGEGVQPTSATLSRALGTVMWGDGAIDWQQGSALKLSDVHVRGEDYAARLDGTLGDIASGIKFAGKVGLSAQDFSRFSGLLGHGVAGAGQLDYSGEFALLTRAFDGVVSAQTTDLALGIAAVDASLMGAAKVTLSARRDESGINLRALDVTARGVTAQLAGKIAAGGIDVSGRFDMLDLPAGERGFGGSMAGQVVLTGVPSDAQVTIKAQSDGLALPATYLRKLAGQGSDITANIAIKNFVPRVVTARLNNPLLRAEITQNQAGGAYLVTASLADLGVVLPEFPGQVTLKGTALPQGDGAALDFALTGPAQLNARILGQASAGQSNDLRITGRADGALINALIAPRSVSGDTAYDLRLRGLPNLAALSGTIKLEDGRLADPSLPFALRKAQMDLRLSGGQIDISGRANATTGGTISVKGTVAARAPYAAKLTIGVNDLGLRNPDLFQSTILGELSLTGPLLGGASLKGRLDLGRTEVQLRVPTIIEGAPLADLRHKGDTRAAQLTRARAGIDQRAKTGSVTAPINLNILVRATNRLFVRGRGLDAELGGEVRLQGDSNDVLPNGSFDLVQGHFDILTTRLSLEAMRLELRGEFIPFLSVRATNSKGGLITTAIIDGPALDPDFKFVSSPELPEEEVLSQLLFDQSLKNLTALQAVQLTSAVASLTGRGEGVIARLRKSLRLDNLDVQSDETGSSALKAGKYLSDKVYSEFSTEGAGKQSLDLTYTLNSKIKLKIGAQTTGNASLGIEIESNY